MIRASILILLAAAAWPAVAEPPPTSAPKKPALDPNERICEEIYVGTRVNRHRFCATRAEWIERRRQERQDVDQMEHPLQCAVMTKHC